MDFSMKLSELIWDIVVICSLELLLLYL